MDNETPKGMKLAVNNTTDLAADVPHPWIEKTTTLTLEKLKQRPEPREMICAHFPVNATSALVSMGGVGKTTWTTHTAIPFLSDDMHVMFVSAEDGEDDYQAKVHNLVFDEAGNRIDPHQVAGRVHILNLKGEGAKMVAEGGGSFVPSRLVDNLINYIREGFPKVRLVIFETVSRFAGGEDNDRMEALVTACDRVAIGISGACLLVHHTGKSQARDKIIDLYSGRGGSALGDNTRSMVVLTRLDDNYMGALPIVVEREQIEAGRVFEATHVRNSYGASNAPEYFITSKGYCNGPTLTTVPIATDADITKAKLEAISAKANKAATEIHNIINQEGGWVKRQYFTNNTSQLIGLTQQAGKDLIVEMLEAGSLAEETRKSSTGQKMNGLVVRNQNKGVSP